ncbi:MAG: hypothetical protein F4X97_10180 [Boseongicola sp. SB0662_bin_57]|nr:hypothetical protein [Boseongicola sp. SB0662_bin_57]
MKRTRFPILAAAVTALCAMTAMAAAAPFDDLDNIGHPVMAFGHDPTEAALQLVPIEAFEAAETVEVASAGMIILGLMPPIVSAAHADPAPEIFLLAHAGQLSPKDDCHRHKAAGERHWHLEGTSTRGGPCLKDSNGETWHLNEHALCSDARIRFAVIEDLDWPTSHDWEEVARELRSCIMGLEPD